MDNLTIIIDGISIPCSCDISPLLTFDSSVMASQSLARDARSIVVQLIDSAQVVSLLAGEGYLHAQRRFNASQHSATLLFNNTPIISGSATLYIAAKEEISERNSVEYSIRITESAATWAHSAAQTSLSKSDIDFSRMLNSEDFAQGWSDNDPVQFFPVHRDSYTSIPSSVSSDTVRRLRGSDDYHPFINIVELLNSIFATNGYSVVSQWMQSDEAKSLFMSGAYSSQCNALAQSQMGFYVQKIEEHQMTADYMGRVYLSLAQYGGCNIADVSSATTVSGCYINSASLVNSSSELLLYTPLSSINVGFEFNIKYIADYRILSRSLLKTFSQFYLQEGQLAKVQVANTLQDFRSEDLINSFKYSVIVFDHLDGRSYRMLADAQGSVGSTLIGTWSSRFAFVTTPAGSVTYSNARVQYTTDGSTYYDLDSDWALYQGVASEYGTAEFDLTLRSTPAAASSLAPITFDNLYAQGAESGMGFKLLAGSSIKSYFSSYPGAGALVSFEDIAHIDIYQSALIDSLMQLYNLRIYSDNTARIVYIEPAEEIFDSAIDWNDRVVESRGVAFKDVAADYSATQSYGYALSDGVTSRLVSENLFPDNDYPYAPESDPEQSIANSSSPDYGAWSYAVQSSAAKESSSTALNQLFAPSQSTTTGLIIVGDRDDVEIADTYQFSTRIVRKVGEVTLDNNCVVPLIVFHSQQPAATLCFEDRDGVCGLNRYYAPELEGAESRQYIDLWIAITPEEVVDLLSPEQWRASILNSFFITVGGESIECRLVEISDYDLTQQHAHCNFITVK